MSVQAADGSDDLAARLLAERRRRGLTQAQAAVEVGTSPQTWGRWEAGKPPQMRWQRVLEEFLNPEAEVVRLLSVPEPNASSKPLTRLQEQAIETALERLAVGVGPGELTFFRAVFAAVGLEWFDD